MTEKVVFHHYAELLKKHFFKLKFYHLRLILCLRKAYYIKHFFYFFNIFIDEVLN